MKRSGARISACIFITALLVACQAPGFPFTPQAAFRRLPLSEYRQKMMAGWLGQMVGVSFGAPTEFRYLGEIIPAEDVPALHPGIANQAFNQDDLYVEMTFLSTLETYGLDATPAQAGLDFANSEYQLWHANSAARMNLRAGIAPPDSGHPAFNVHADDIDYQIQSDFAGLISPGLPAQAIRLGDTFGRLMNYGDGLYGGQFVSCMYSEAFFESDPARLVEAGLACIPARSQYAEAVRDVLGWWRENPQDWQATWQKIDAKYQADPDYRRASCSDVYFDEHFNIDAKINGAYVVMGMLYGAGNPLAAMIIAMRGGQDSDCNPASAGGITSTTLGWDQLPAAFTAGLDTTEEWSYTDYDFQRLVELCEKLARESVLKAGGKVEVDSASSEEVWLIPVQRPKPGPLEQSWRPGPVKKSLYPQATLETITVGSARLAQAVPGFAPGWQLTSCKEESLLGLKEDVNGRPAALMLQSGDWMPCTIASRVTLPAGHDSRLHLEVGSLQGKPWLLLVRVDGQELLQQVIGDGTKPEAWYPLDVDLSAYRGKSVVIEVSDMLTENTDRGALGLIADLSIQTSGP